MLLHQSTILYIDKTVNHLTPDTSGLVVADNMTPNLLLSENSEHLRSDFLECFKVSSKSSHSGFYRDTLSFFAVLSEYVETENLHLQDSKSTNSFLNGSLNCHCLNIFDSGHTDLI